MQRQRRLVRVGTTAAVVALLLGLTGAMPASARPAHCDRNGNCTPASGLRWTSPAVIYDNVPATYSSITPCPTTRPDGSPLQGQLEVQLFIDVGGGGAGNIFPTNPDGSWSVTTSFNFGGGSYPNATVTASCQDVTFTGFTVANYKPHAISVNPVVL